MDGGAVVETLEGIEASVAALTAVVGRGGGTVASTGADPFACADPFAGADAFAGADPLRDQADACLDGLAEVGRLEARLAALKVQFAAGYAAAAEVLAVRCCPRPAP
jgi:hypothetical protein